MPTVDDYKALITSAWQDKPKFMQTVEVEVDVATRVQELLASMIPIFDVDGAVGEQLDIIGEWVGVSRDVAIPITGVYFSWDGDFNLGWDFGVWQPPNTPTSITMLPDDSYRTLIRAKISANQWDGTTEGAYAIWSRVFPEITILIQDNQDMSYDIGFVGGIIDSLTLALITGGYLPLKPEGVLQDVVFIPINPGPLFAWDSESTYIAGWDEGSWAIEIT